MRADLRRVLSGLSFNYVHAPNDVWAPSTVHVDGLHEESLRRIGLGFRDAELLTETSPAGIALQGQKGAGKTHLLGLVRERVHRGNGYFFLVSLLDGYRFWETMAQSLLDGLWRRTPDGQRQVDHLIDRLWGGSPQTTPPAGTPAGDYVAALVSAVRRKRPDVGLKTQHTLRALVLYASSDHHAQDIGQAFLSSMPEVEDGERRKFGIMAGTHPASAVVSDLIKLLAITGPIVIAVDQIDILVAQAARYTDDRHLHPVGPAPALIEEIAAGLMALREVTWRTLTVVACLPNTWTLIRKYAVDTVADRFEDVSPLRTIPSESIASALVEKRLAGQFSGMGFQPPYPTWPVRPEAFQRYFEFTPRGLLMRVNEHIQDCLRKDEFRELTSLNGAPATALSTTHAFPAFVGPAGGRDHPELSTFVDLDQRFLQLRAKARVGDALSPDTEDTAIPALMSAGLRAWIAERGPAGAAYTVDPLPGPKPALHARLRRTLDDQTDDELHWSFRAITSNHALSVVTRIRNAAVMSGLDPGVPKRRLILLRNTKWLGGPKNRDAMDAFQQAGGVHRRLDEEDLRTFAALRGLLAGADANPLVLAWLQERQHATRCALLADLLSAEAADATAAAVDAAEIVPEFDSGDEPAAEPRPEAEPEPAPPPSGATIPVGRLLDGSGSVTLALESLRKHTAIFAGSGSGKTVLIRRLLEECALHGVSAIVLDPNNDLARLGVGWPDPPIGWSDDDPERAATYLRDTDVVVWTPRKESGRPLSFLPLPDFRSVRNDQDELNAAIDAAVATLAPRAKVGGASGKADLKRAVLRETLTHFAKHGIGGIRAFIAMLNDLPDGVSSLDNADRYGAELAQTLTAAMVNDPLFGGDGVPVDPGVLLTPVEGKRARISVISLVGLPGDDQRQSFVNQLQMALFAWIKNHPAGDRPLGGLFVMDEAQTFAPSGAMTACTQSTLALASQARKYGLGLVFATQAPKALHNRIPGNAATQFFGLLNAPVQIAAAKEMAHAKGGDVSGIGRLRTGQFYVSAEGVAFEQVQSPMSLSYHPASPLTTEEVISRANPRPVPVVTPAGRSTVRKASGSLFGLAYGDSLGKPTEFLTYQQIVAQHGPGGPTALTGDPALVTDDTQMTLAVADALLAALEEPPLTPHRLVPRTIGRFMQWAQSPENNRAPGMTCMRAIGNLALGQPWLQATRRGSKGCGANMRVAPVGLVAGLTDDQRAGAAQLQAALTHGHPTGLAASELTAFAVHWLRDGLAPADLPAALRQRCVEQRTNYRDDWLDELWQGPGATTPEDFIALGWDECLGVLDRLDAALENPSGITDPCQATGEGWIAEEALATAVLSFLLHTDDPVAGLGRAAATNGDSDSIACLTGAFAGAAYGMDAWPAEWATRIEYHQELQRFGAAWD